MKLCVVTGTRAEYGLLYPLLKAIELDESLDLQLIVTGMHLSHAFGYTIQEIEKDFKIDKKIEILLSGDSHISISKSMALAQISMAEAYESLMPDALIVLGDRFEIMAGCIAAMVATIPIIHISGGEKTMGAMDEAIRHSITKMSHLHFVSTEEYRQRVIQLGEQPQHVFNVGALSVDNVQGIQLLPRDAFEQSIGFNLNVRNLLVTIHPETLSGTPVQVYCTKLLSQLDQLEKTNIIFTKSNADEGGLEINQMIEDYVKNNQDHAILIDSLGQLKYLSALQFVDAVVGNSSSGIVEAPLFKIGTINIGDRQAGRIRCQSIIDCSWDEDAIYGAFEKLYSESFQNTLDSFENPYGDGQAAKKIIKQIKKFDFSHAIKKSFYDIIFDGEEKVWS